MPRAGTPSTRYDEFTVLLADQLMIGEEEIDDSADIYEDLGADSLDAVELIMALEEKYGVEITDGEFEKLRTVGELKIYLKENGVEQL